MSISDFDNDTPDNRPAERWTRIADAARLDERRKIWRAAGLGQNPPTGDAAFVTGILDAGARRVGLELPVAEVADQVREDAGDSEITLTLERALDTVTLARKNGRREALADVLRAAGLPAFTDEMTPEHAAHAIVRETLRKVLGAAGVPQGEVADRDDPEIVSLAVRVQGKMQGYRNALADAADTAGFADVPSTARDLIVRVRHEALDDIDRAIRGETLAPHADVDVAPYASRARAHVLGEARPFVSTRARDEASELRRVMDVVAHVVGCAAPAPVALRSEALARAVVRLHSLPDPTPVHYLRLVHDGGTDWFCKSAPPRYGLSEDFESELVAQAAAALDARDGAGYLDVLRRVADECTLPDLSPLVAATGQRPDHVWASVPSEANTVGDQRHAGRIAAVQELRPLLQALRAALGFAHLDTEPVHVHELYANLNALVRDVSRVRDSVAWIAALNALNDQGLRERIATRRSQHGRHGLDLATLTTIWQAYLRDLELARDADESFERLGKIDTLKTFVHLTSGHDLV